MPRIQRLIGLALLVGIAATLILSIVLINASVLASPAENAGSLPAVVPVASPESNQADIDIFSWQTFIALNRPAALDAQGRPVRDDAFANGKPDLTKALDAPGPRVWEGLKALRELFRPGGKTPAFWNEYDNDLPCRVVPSEENPDEKTQGLISEGSFMKQEVNQGMAGPLIDRFGSYVHYEVRHNKAYYDFVRDNKFYLRDELDLKHRWPKKMVQFPISDPDKNAYGALEVTAAWRILDPSEDEIVAQRYYWRWARIPDPVTGKCGSPQRIALVGLHIIMKVEGFNSWLWATFEHVDNVPCSYSDMKTCPPPPQRYSFNAQDQQLDDEARQNRGYTPLIWRQPPYGARWKPVAPQDLPAEPVPLSERANAVRMLPVAPSATARNAEFHAKEGIKGTFWENYILIDTQWPLDGDEEVKPPAPGSKPTESKYIEGALNPEPGPGAMRKVQMANVTMETYYQQTNPRVKSFGGSCMQCHYSAAQTDFSWILANRAWPPPVPAMKPGENRAHPVRRTHYRRASSTVRISFSSLQRRQRTP